MFDKNFSKKIKFPKNKNSLKNDQKSSPKKSKPHKKILIINF